MNCCENFTFQHETKRCANIHIPLDDTANDKVFRTNHKACMKFTRSDRAKAVNEISQYSEKALEAPSIRLLFAKFL